MDAFLVFGGILTLSNFLAELPRLDEKKRILEDKFEFLRARIDDVENIERPSFSLWGQRTNKRKRDDDLSTWVDEGRELLKKAENLLSLVDESRSLLTLAKKRKVLSKVVDALEVHDKKGNMLDMNQMSEERGPSRGYYLPVQEITGQAALNTMEELEHLLQDAEVGRIVIKGREGIGKTFLMKHLHNRALKWIERFDYVFWVTCPDEFSIKNVQDAVAAVVKCDLSGNDNLNLRAGILSNKFASLGSFVLFVDGVLKSDISWDEIGFTLPEVDRECKLVLTTNSASQCRIFDGFETVELDCLSENEALELFLHQAKIDMNSVALLDNIPLLLVKKCYGVPRMAVNLASRMYGIEDLHEWRNTLFELEP